MRKQRFKAAVFLSVFTGLAFTGLLPTAVARGDETQPLVVHEWGTFTVLQDESGKAVDGVNINEESLPPFVHKLGTDLTPDSHELGPLISVGYSRARASKGILRYYHAARMRMETPIIYLHPPQDQPRRPINVNVDFKGGWITEWYPKAQVTAAGYKGNNKFLMSSLKPTTTGSIAWRDLKTDNKGEVPVTDYPVWVAPRRTAAPKITTPSGETENYLFYRGVANLEAPLRVTRQGAALTITPNDRSTCRIEDYRDLDLWLVDVDPQGKLQYRTVKLNEGAPSKTDPKLPLATTSAMFEEAPSELPKLRDEMLASLIDRGLFQDEAEAMLNTWEVSYFRTSGLRLFFTLPQAWTDRVLPLQVSGYEKTTTVRTMIGRIEMISTRQRKLMDIIASSPTSDRSWFIDWLKKSDPAVTSKISAVAAGRMTLEQLGLKPPKDYQAYMELGRFRDALIRHEIANSKQPSPNMRQFADNYGLPK
jgi:hypothetical protein